MQDLNDIPSDKSLPEEENPVDPLAVELQELKDKYMRVHADMENMRRRQERERVDLVKFALENAFKDFLPVLDSLETALPDAPATPNGEGENPDAFRQGMLMVKRQLLEVFKRHGLEPINAQGAPFDPNLHQAIQRVESPDVQSEVVGAEYAKGYLLNGRLIRPSMVSVLVPPGS